MGNYIQLNFFWRFWDQFLVSIGDKVDNIGYKDRFAGLSALVILICYLFITVSLLQNRKQQCNFLFFLICAQNSISTRTISSTNFKIRSKKSLANISPISRGRDIFTFRRRELCWMERSATPKTGTSTISRTRRSTTIWKLHFRTEARKVTTLLESSLSTCRTTNKNINFEILEFWKCNFVN